MFVDQFEVEMAKYTGSKRAVACVNGTSALHLALKLAGVEQGDEVITQPLTFVATANAIMYCGAKPVFLDVDMDTMGLSPKALKEWLEENVEMKEVKIKVKVKVKVEVKGPQSQPHPQPQPQPQPQPYNLTTGRRISACIPMHTFGHPCRIDEIVRICEKYNIPVVEDAAESLGSFYKNQHTGTFGKIGVLSFNGNKILTTGGGGMLLFHDEELAKHARHLTTQAKIPHPWEFVHDEVGYNYRMPNINAALGLAQLEQIPLFLQSKRLIAEAYKAFFSTATSTSTSASASPSISASASPSTSASTSPSTFVSEPPHARSNYWLNCILLINKEERDDFLKHTNENGIMTRPAWQLMNLLPMYKQSQKDDLINSKELSDRLVNIPSSVK